jgi:hypothetical protein
MDSGAGAEQEATLLFNQQTNTLEISAQGSLIASVTVA